jgi:hypothetical protein
MTNEQVKKRAKKNHEVEREYETLWRSGLYIERHIVCVLSKPNEWHVEWIFISSELFNGWSLSRYCRLSSFCIKTRQSLAAAEMQQ